VRLTRVLDRFVPLSPVSPTPVQPMDRLGSALGLGPGRLWVKRDDLTGLGGGGNKVRKLEHLCADALDQGCDTLVTGGGRQSNHVRMTAAAANHLGLRCTIVLGSDPPDQATGNVVLDHLLGPDIVWAGPLGYYDLEDAITAEADRLRAAGRRPYAMPLGGASTVGQLGYVRAALELREQLPDTTLIVTADGTGGTHAGLVGGWGDHDAVLGVDVGTRPDLDDVVPREATAAAVLAGRAEPTGTCRIDHERVGGGYGAPTEACREALDLCARHEGLLLDPVYSGKGMAGLIAAVRDGRTPTEGTIVFIATGGLPALLTPRYTDWVVDWPA
jgi:1-aminocyclopropane-1-carboxylate deaminase/D-cysteine desulfhydrase-like pyridoxal-dependent ACC family enzyme